MTFETWYLGVKAKEMVKEMIFFVCFLFRGSMLPWPLNCVCVSPHVCSDRRLADHFGGKLHLGYMAIRQKQAELKVTYPAAPTLSVSPLSPTSHPLPCIFRRRGRVRHTGKWEEEMSGGRSRGLFPISSCRVELDFCSVESGDGCRRAVCPV